MDVWVNVKVGLWIVYGNEKEERKSGIPLVVSLEQCLVKLTNPKSNQWGKVGNDLLSKTQTEYMMWINSNHKIFAFQSSAALSIDKNN